MVEDAKKRVRLTLLADTDLVGLLKGPNVFQLAAPAPNTFPRITVFELDNAPAAFADDQSFASDISVQVDLWHKGAEAADSLGVIAGEVDRIMKASDWVRTSAVDLYEQDTKIYHKAMRYRRQIEEV